jgi:ectoine hydroxylase-related dioxygenase (phytanoyl-CoA dioxygenase family)
VLNVEVFDAKDVDAIAHVFHRDGFAAVRGILNSQQFETIQAGAARVIEEQTAAINLESANRGFARYSFGDQMSNPEWAMLADLPAIHTILEKICNSPNFACIGGGGDYSVPGAKIQPLHSDIGDFLKDPLGQVTIRDVPVPFIVVNFTMVDFAKENGAIRFIPCTQRSRAPIPNLEQEPEWMKNSILCAPAGTAIVRDVRCWHGGTANTSNQIRPMTSVGFTAPWFRMERQCHMPARLYRTLSPRGQELCAGIADL